MQEDCRPAYKRGGKMTDETRTMIEVSLSFLKTQMGKEGLIFAFAVDRKDVNKSKLCFIDKEKYLKNRERDGLMISISDLNDGLW